MSRILGILLVFAIVFGLASANDAEPEGNAFGFGCTLSGGATFDTPGDMLKYLTERDGHFQITVAKYHFDSVADLIAQKCGVQP